jgi:glycosyltransferase involved in cell wall biosynthesis
MTPRIVFYCGRTIEEFAPPKLNETGIGGSETAVVEIAKRFAADGWRVDVYTSAGRYEGEHDDVGYWEPGRLGPDERADVLVSWRHPEAHGLPVEARARVLWLHDHNGAAAWAPFLPHWDRVLGVSAYHRDFLAAAYALPPERVGYVPNGIDLDRFGAKVRKIPGRVVYASSPDRDLATLLKMWPEIIGSEKKPELHICYGWNNIDRWIESGRSDLAEFKAEVTALIDKTPQVVFRGRIPQDELARLYQESYAWLYPTSFTETSCISAMEAMAGGCVPVCSSVGALKDTVGDGGLVVYGPGKTRSNPYSPAWRDYFVLCARAVLFEMNTRKTLEKRARERAKAFTWDASYGRWKSIIGELLGDTPASEPTPNGRVHVAEAVPA